MEDLYKEPEQKPTEEINAEDISEKVLKSFPLKHANGVIMGRTGAGKTTLLNTYFKKPLALGTGVGAPQTQEIKTYTTDDGVLSIFDTRGIEIKNFKETFKIVKDFIDSHCADTSNAENHIHFLWFCISMVGKRIEKYEANFIKEIYKKVPVIIVVTQSYTDDEDFIADIKDNVPKEVKIVKVLAQPYKLRGGINVPATGLEDLTDATVEILPEGQANSLINVTNHSLSVKKKLAIAAIAAATTAAGAVAAVPIPFSDCFALAPIQVTMLGSICAIYGIPVSKSSLMTIVGGLIGSTGATLLGKTIVTSLLKLVPGVNLAASVISGGTAVTLTSTIGGLFHAGVIYEIEHYDKPSLERIVKYVKDHQ